MTDDTLFTVYEQDGAVLIQPRAGHAKVVEFGDTYRLPIQGQWLVVSFVQDGAAMSVTDNPHIHEVPPGEAKCPACGQQVERLLERVKSGLLASSGQEVFAASPCGHPLTKYEAGTVKKQWLAHRIEPIFDKVKR